MNNIIDPAYVLFDMTIKKRVIHLSIILLYMCVELLSFSFFSFLRTIRTVYIYVLCDVCRILLRFVCASLFPDNKKGKVFSGFYIPTLTCV